MRKKFIRFCSSIDQYPKNSYKKNRVEDHKLLRRIKIYFKWTGEKVLLTKFVQTEFWKINSDRIFFSPANHFIDLLLKKILQNP